MTALSSPQANGSAGPKQISSRLLNMKFMQRAAFSSKTRPSSTPQTPGSEPPSKRRRTGDDLDSNLNSSTSFASSHTPTNTDRPTTGADKPLSQDFRSYAGEHYETHWVLDNQPQGRHIPANEPDQSSEDDIWSPINTTSGVQTYGAFKKKPKPTPKPPSVSKSARRNAARNHNQNTNPDHSSNLSSYSSNSESDSHSNSASESDSSHESNAYSASRAHHASHRSRVQSRARPLSTYNPNPNNPNFMRFDRSLSPRGHSDAVGPSRAQFFDTPTERKTGKATGAGKARGDGNGKRDRGDGGKDKGDRHKRKTM